MPRCAAHTWWTAGEWVHAAQVPSARPHVAVHGWCLSCSACRLQGEPERDGARGWAAQTQDSRSLHRLDHLPAACLCVVQEEHERGGCVGLDVASGEPADPHLAGVLDNYIVKRQILQRWVLELKRHISEPGGKHNLDRGPVVPRPPAGRRLLPGCFARPAS